MSARRPSGDTAHVGVSATSLARSRLLTNVDLGESTQTALLIAPPGAGKTTLLAGLAVRVATRPDAVSARYQAPLATESSSSLLRKLVESWRPALGTKPARIRTFEMLLHRVGASDAQFFLFVDDAQRLIGQSAADGLTTLLTRAPGNLSIAVASRTDVLPSASLLMGSAPTVRIGYDDLRFRAGETAQLFAEVYRRPLPPEAAAELCRLTDGWATALRIFDLDHRMLDDAGRSAAVSMGSVDSPLLRDYLHHTIMSSLPDSIQDFMIQTCPLGVLEGRLCDAFLGRSGSSAVLKGLAARHLLVFQSGGYFHHHALLQRHLERLLVERTSPADAALLYRRAAEHLVDRGHWPEAYRAFAHAEEWVGAAQVLRASRAKWESLYVSAFVPAVLLRDDPWVALTNARRFRGNGQFAQACEAYDEAVAGFDDPRMRWRATVERATVSRWLAAGPEPVPDSPDDQTDDLSRYLRAALDSRPARLLVRSEDDLTPAWRLVQALAAALDGRIEPAVQLAESSADSTDRFVSIAGRLTAAGLAAMSPTPATPAARPSTFTALAAEAASAGWPWLARLARAATTLADPSYLADATAVLDESRRLDDDWGALLAGVAVTLARWRGGADATGVLRDTLRLARRLDAVALETWLRKWSTAEAVDPGKPSDDTSAYQRAAGPDPKPAAEPAPVVLHCFGRYEFFVSGVLRDTSKLRRQARTVLWLLSLHVGKPVQEETLTSTIWPEVLPFKAKHRLHVAISSLRRALDPGAQPRASNLIVRVGSAYVLSPPPGSKVDLLVFESSIRRWRLTRSHASVDELTRTLSTALDAYRADLLTEAGPAEWVLTERDRLRTEAANAAAALAVLQLEHDAHLAIGACMSGLRIDDLHYGLWRLLAQAHTRAGNRAEAARAQKAYTDLMSG